MKQFKLCKVTTKTVVATLDMKDCDVFANIPKIKEWVRDMSQESIKLHNIVSIHDTPTFIFGRMRKNWNAYVKDNTLTIETVAPEYTIIEL